MSTTLTTSLSSAVKSIREIFPPETVRPSGLLDKFIKSVEDGTDLISPLRENANPSAYASLAGDLVHSIYELSALKALKPVSFQSNAHYVFNWIKTQFEKDRMDTEMHGKRDSESRAKLYKSVAQFLLLFSDLVSPEEYVHLVSTYKIDTVFLPLSVKDPIFDSECLGDIISLHALAGRGPFVQQMILLGITPAPEPTTGSFSMEDFYGRCITFNTTRLCYEEEGAKYPLAYLLERKGFIANHTDTVSMENMCWLSDVSHYHADGHEQFRANLIACKLNSAYWECNYEPDYDAKAQMEIWTLSFKHLAASTSWDDAVRLFDLRGCHIKRAEQALTHLSKGITCALVQHTLESSGLVKWLSCPNGISVIDTASSKKHEKLVVNLHTKEHQDIAYALSKHIPTYILSSSSESGLFKLTRK